MYRVSLKKHVVRLLPLALYVGHNNFDAVSSLFLLWMCFIHTMAHQQSVNHFTDMSRGISHLWADLEHMRYVLYT